MMIDDVNYEETFLGIFGMPCAQVLTILCSLSYACAQMFLVLR